MKLKIKKRTTNWRTSPSTTTVEYFEIDKPTEDEAFAHYFREYVNRFKYCNDIHFSIVDKKQAEAYHTWINDVKNYIANGGDMW